MKGISGFTGTESGYLSLAVQGIKFPKYGLFSGIIYLKNAGVLVSCILLFATRFFIYPRITACARKRTADL